MSIIIGGVPSTGSSLLVNILNRHPDIATGPETYLFIHKQLYQNWGKYKNRLIGTGKIFGLKSQGWFIKNGADLLQTEYGWDRANLKRIIQESPDFIQFAENYFSKNLANQNAQIWIEKSPSNAIALKEFLNHFPKGKVIHTCRNPYDTVASLMSRGMNVYNAVAVYLVNSALALRAETGKYYEIKYEKLVNLPEQELRILLGFCNLNFDEKILEGETAKTQKMPGWKQNERGAIQKSSLGRFYDLTDHQREMIKATFATLKINKKWADKIDLKYLNAPDLFERLDYKFMNDIKFDIRHILKKMQRQDILQRTFRLYPSHFWNYPLEIL